MNESFFEHLQKRGWAKTAVSINTPVSLADSLHTIASALNRWTPYKKTPIQRLSPKSRSEAKCRSLSGRFGLGDFPLHCDTSHWPTPCRYVVLACEHPGSAAAPTALLGVDEVAMLPSQRALAHSAPFIVQNGRRSFFSTVFSSTRRFTRMDPGCMTPVDENGMRIMALFTYANNAKAILPILWERGDILAIDNWQFLHGRISSTQVGDDRVLLRVLVQ